MDKGKERWEEDESKIFSDYGEIYVPYRELQSQIFLQLLSSVTNLEQVVELGCGEGLLSEKILKQFPEVKVTGMDLSPFMLEKTKLRLNSFGNRFTTRAFDLAADEWRSQLGKVGAFVSSLVIHHLDEDQKRSLYQDLFNQLSIDGMIIIADIVRPSSAIGYQIAGDVWDKDVQYRAKSSDQHKAYQIFKEDGWNYFQNPDSDPIDKPSTLADQLRWLNKAGFEEADVYWMYAGHALFAGRKCRA